MAKRTLLGLGVFLFSFVIHSSWLQARMIQIIHTNDLHSYFQGYPDGRGGYSRVKSLIEELKQEGRNAGISTFLLDAGDWGEGTSFFISDRGVDSVKALDIFGVDAAVVGNHDHLLGPDILSEQLTRAHNEADIISANIVFPKGSRARALIPRVSTLKRDGFIIRVIGLSTMEPHYQYTVQPGFILPPSPILKIYENFARKDGADLVVALTHLGVHADEKLVKSSKEVDVVIGGHSHTRLDDVLYEKNKKGRKIPIVQTGAHGLAVGNLILDVRGPGEVSVVSYELHDVTEEVPENQEMESLVEHAIEYRNQYFEGEWDTVVGESEVELLGYKDGNAQVKKSCWGEHMAQMAQDATGADIGLHLATFQGVQKDPGAITYGDLVDSFPHFRSYNEPGWRIATFEATGLEMKAIILTLDNLKDGFGVDFSSVSWKSLSIPSFIPIVGGKKLTWDFKIGGKRLKNFKKYKIAFPAEVGFSLRELFKPAQKLLFPKFTETENFYWNVMRDYVVAHSPIQCKE